MQKTFWFLLLLLIAVISFLLPFLSVKHAFSQDVFQLDQITRADVVAIQRGWPSDISQCAIDVYQQIKVDSEAGMLWVIIADPNINSLTFERLDQTNKIVCQTEGRRNIGTGVNGSQVYDSLTPY